MATRRRLARSQTDRMIAGVAGGIAAHFDLDPTLVRVMWVITVIFAGFGVLPYIILWIVLPTEGSPAPSPALGIAEERYARGEISKEELDGLRADLTRR